MDLNAIIEHFVLFSFGIGSNGEETAMFGINTEDPSKKFIEKVTKISTDKIRFPSSVYSTAEKQVINIINDIPLNNEHHLLVVSRLSSGGANDEIFEVELLNEKLQVVTSLVKTTVTPLYFLDAVSNTPILVYQSKNNIVFGRITINGLTSSDFKPISGKLAPNHTSAYLDLTGNLIPDLALITINEDMSVNLDIHRLVDGNFTCIQKLNLGSNIHSIAFIFSEKDYIHYDLIVIKDSNEGAFLSLYQNLKNSESLQMFRDIDKTLKYLKASENFTENIYSETPAIHPLKCSIRKTNGFGMQSGIFIADINSSGRQHIFVITEEGKIKGFRLKNKAINEVSYQSRLDSLTKVLSISAADFNDFGQLSLVINSEEEAKCKLFSARISKEVIYNKIDLTSVSGTPSFSSHVPGLSYLMGLDNGSRFKKFSQPSQNSYPSLYKPGVFVGLGETNFFLQYLLVGIPFSKSPAIDQIKFDLFPNTTCIFFIEDRDLLTFKVYFKSPHIAAVFYFLAVFAMVDLIILVYLTYREKNMTKKNKKVNGMTQLFNVL